MWSERAGAGGEVEGNLGGIWRHGGLMVIPTVRCDMSHKAWCVRSCEYRWDLECSKELEEGRDYQAVKVK